MGADSAPEERNVDDIKRVRALIESVRKDVKAKKEARDFARFCRQVARDRATLGIGRGRQVTS